MNILLLSGYDAASHKRWRLDLQHHLAHHHWTQLALPPRYFNWRIRGNSMSWAFSQRELLTQQYDLLIATSMVDLSALRGFIPSLAAIPTVLYFHENQFSYPANEAQFASVEPQIITLYSALCADKLVFNSDFNRTTFLTGAEALLRKLPDHVPAGLSAILQQRSSVLAVPLAAECFSADQLPASRKVNTPLTLIWNHRWEYDKGPERLLAMLTCYFECYQLNSQQRPFILHVVGQQFRQTPNAFAEIKTLLAENNALGQWGYVDSADDYRALLRDSDVVLSTALHDFQGLAVLEAVAAGCVPLLPARQAYPEWFGADVCYISDLENPQREAQAMAQKLIELNDAFTQEALPTAPDLSHFHWSQLATEYESLLSDLMTSS